MKKLIIGVLVFFILLIAVAVALPIVFKDDIKAVVDQQIDKSVDATVYFDAEQFSVSLIRHFPSLNVSLGDFAVIGKGEFEGDTLLSLKEFIIDVNAISVISGDEITINQISLIEPTIHVQVKEDGTANYNIAKSDSTQTQEESTGESNIQITIEQWEVVNANIVYDDKSQGAYAQIKNLNHAGSGNFSLDVFDLSTNTSMEALTISYGDVNYFNKNTIDAAFTMLIDLPNSTYTFNSEADNYLKVNDLTLGFEGFLKQMNADYEMDVKFDVQESTFKSLISLVPAIFLEGFEQMKVDGDLAFDGLAKGTYSEERNLLPAFHLNLKVNEGRLQYPNLPKAVENINIDMEIDNPDGVLANTLTDIKKFNMRLGSNPVNGKVKVKGIEELDVDAEMNAKVNLEELATMFPVEGYELKGLYTLALKAKGIYSNARQTIPKIDAKMELTSGFIKSAEYPIPIENLTVLTNVQNTTGKFKDTYIYIKNAEMLVDNEPFKVRGEIYNMADYTYDFDVNGTLNLDMIDKIYPLEGMALAGKIRGNIQTKGKMSDIEAERYGNLPTSGKVEVNQLVFKSTDLPQGMKISTATLSFNPKDMVLEKFEGYLGKSEMILTGRLSNYIGYALTENSVLKGVMAMNSSYFDANEWMVEEETTTPDSVAENYEVIPIPKNLDFVFAATIDKVTYTNMDLNNMQGKVIMRNGIVTLENVAFNSLGGQFVSNGKYDTSDPAKPAFDFDLDIKNLSFQKSYNTFNTIKTFAPLAQNITGDFSTKFKIAGLLGQDMLPIMQTLTGGGDISVVEAAIKGVTLLNKLSEQTNINELNNPQLKDILLKTSFENGKLKIAPFNVKIGGYTANVSGTTSFTGEIDYKVGMDLSVSKLVNNQMASQYTALTGETTVPMLFNIGGSYGTPTVAPSQDMVKNIQAKVANSLKQNAKSKLLDLLSGNDAKSDSAQVQPDSTLLPSDSTKNRVDTNVQVVQDSTLKTQDDVVNEKQKALKENAEKLKGLFNKNKPKTDTTKRN